MDGSGPSALIPDATRNDASSSLGVTARCKPARKAAACAPRSHAHTLSPAFWELLLCLPADAFVGGFLSGVTTGASVEDSVKAGNYAANVVIQRAGCTFPAEAPAL